MRLIILSVVLVLASLSVACSSPDNESVIATAVAQNIGTALASTVEAQAVQTGVAATQAALDTPTPVPNTLCAVEANDFLDSASAIAEKWFDALEVADSTPRISLAGPVSELQTIRRELAALEAPLCAGYAQLALENHMTEIIDAFLSFMQDEPESVISANFESASDWLDEYLEALDAIREESAEATREALVTPTPVQ